MHGQYVSVHQEAKLVYTPVLIARVLPHMFAVMAAEWPSRIPLEDTVTWLRSTDMSRGSPRRNIKLARLLKKVPLLIPYVHSRL